MVYIPFNLRLLYVGEAAERFALVVVGRAGIMPESRKNPKRGKCL
jgi:hypothetical protein